MNWLKRFLWLARGQSLNLLVVGLLVGIAYAVLTVPEFNYDQLTSRQEDLKERMSQLESQIAEAREKAEEVHAATPGLLSDLASQYAHVTESLARTTHELDMLERRLRGLEDVVVDTDALASRAEDAPTDVDAARRLLERFQEKYTSSLKLAPELRAKAREINAEDLMSYNFGDFAQQMHEMGLVPYDYSEIPEAAEKKLHGVFNFYVSTLLLVDSEKRIATNALVDSYSRTGNYQEFSTDTPREGVLAALGEVPDGTIHIKRFQDLGVWRAFVFPHDRHAELLEYSVRATNTIEHLIKDVHLLGEKWRQ